MFSKFFVPGAKNHTYIPTLNIRNATVVRVPDLRAHQSLRFPVANQVRLSYPPCIEINTIPCLLATGGEHAARIGERRGKIQWGRERMGQRVSVSYVPFIYVTSTHVGP